MKYIPQHAVFIKYSLHFENSEKSTYSIKFVVLKRLLYAQHYKIVRILLSVICHSFQANQILSLSMYQTWWQKRAVADAEGDEMRRMHPQRHI